MKGVTVIIPCYNAGKYLTEAVASVHLTSPETPYEIIVVDDASTDPATQEALKNTAATDKHARVLSMSLNSGQSAARNFAMEIARYDVILPLDADDRLHHKQGQPSYIDLAYKTLMQDSAAFAVAGHYRQFGAIEAAGHTYPFTPAIHLVKNLLPPFSAFSRAEALDAGGYATSLRYGEDWDMYTTLMNGRFKKNKDYAVINLPEVCVDYRIHESGLNASVKHKEPRIQSLSAMMNRNPEIYDHYYPGRTVESLASQKTLLLSAFYMATEHPVELARMAQSIGLRHLHNRWHRKPESP